MKKLPTIPISEINCYERSKVINLNKMSTKECPIVYRLPTIYASVREYGKLKAIYTKGECVEFHDLDETFEDTNVGDVVNLKCGDPIIFKNMALIGKVKIRGYFYFAFQQQNTKAWLCFNTRWWQNVEIIE